MQPFTKQILERQAKPLYLVPCVITQVSPLQVSMLGAANVPAVSIPGCTYTVNAPANALLTSPGKPIILPIGP
ncbi:hypothetical protein [Leifsonia sp. P73]|uniref:hypothetical protein n=1 Tax=Leifsonia sp. P73 TaxID=3423959 RepID=UPI003DA55F58